MSSTMMAQSEMATELVNRLEEALPPIIKAAGLNPIAQYSSGSLPNNTDERQLVIVPASGEFTTELRKEIFYMLLMLPKETRPDKYLSAIWPHLGRIMQPFVVDMLTLDMEYQLDYLGEAAGGATDITNIEIVLTYELPLDDATYNELTQRDREKR